MNSDRIVCFVCFCWVCHFPNTVLYRTESRNEFRARFSVLHFSFNVNLMHIKVTCRDPCPKPYFWLKFMNLCHVSDTVQLIVNEDLNESTVCVVRERKGLFYPERGGGSFIIIDVYDMAYLLLCSKVVYGNHLIVVSDYC
jgi:hypothetical protein